MECISNHTHHSLVTPWVKNTSYIYRGTQNRCTENDTLEYKRDSVTKFTYFEDWHLQKHIGFNTHWEQSSNNMFCSLIHQYSSLTMWLVPENELATQHFCTSLKASTHWLFNATNLTCPNACGWILLWVLVYRSFSYSLTLPHTMTSNNEVVVRDLALMLTSMNLVIRHIWFIDQIHILLSILKMGNLDKFQQFKCTVHTTYIL